MRSEGNNQANPECQVYHRTTEPICSPRQSHGGKKGKRGKDGSVLKRDLETNT